MVIAVEAVTPPPPPPHTHGQLARGAPIRQLGQAKIPGLSGKLLPFLPSSSVRVSYQARLPMLRPDILLCDIGMRPEKPQRAQQAWHGRH